MFCLIYKNSRTVVKTILLSLLEGVKFHEMVVMARSISSIDGNCCSDVFPRGV